MRGVRLDSGDLADHACKVRRILDAGGLADTIIFASGNLDEYRLAEIEARGAPIRGYGVGTSLTTSADAPYLDSVYKLQEYAGIARRKRSEGKATWPGRKQVYRRRDGDGRYAGDLLTTLDDRDDGEALLAPVMRDGRRVAPPRPLTEIRDFALAQYERLPAAVRALENPAPYEVAVSGPLRRLADEVDRRTR